MSLLYDNVQHKIAMRGMKNLGNGSFGFTFKFHYGNKFFLEVLSAIHELQEKCYALDAEVHSFKTNPGYSLEGGLSTSVYVVIKCKNDVSYNQT